MPFLTHSPPLANLVAQVEGQPFIVLSGANNCGKTATLRQLSTALKGSPWVVRVAIRYSHVQSLEGHGANIEQVLDQLKTRRPD